MRTARVDVAVVLREDRLQERLRRAASFEDGGRNLRPRARRGEMKRIEQERSSFGSTNAPARERLEFGAR
jgi:hypothetical protein